MSPASKSAVLSALNLQRQADGFPLAPRDGWLAFARAKPGCTWAAEHDESLFGHDQYARYAARTGICAQRIIYPNDGLKIKGLMISPTMPAPHPVIICNHGKVIEAGRIIRPEALGFHRLAERGSIVLASAYRGKKRNDGLPSMDGGEDPRVSPDATLRMASALQRLHRSYRLTLSEGGSHDQLGNYAGVRGEIDRWLDRDERLPRPSNGVTTLPLENKE